MAIDSSGCENRFPNCVRVELEIRPIDEDSFDLVADIRFGEQRIRTNKYGEVTFGLRRGRLKVELDKGKVPLRNIKLDKVFQTEVEVKVQQVEGQEKKVGGNLGFKAGASAVGTSTSSAGQEFSYKEYRVRTEGEQTDPCWVFEAEYMDFLEGLLREAELATVNVLEKPCRLIATFEVRNIEDICLKDGKLLGIKNITKKKLAVVERWIAKRWIEEALKDKPYLSRVELAYG